MKNRGYRITSELKRTRFTDHFLIYVHRATVTLLCSGFLLILSLGKVPRIKWDKQAHPWVYLRREKLACLTKTLCIPSLRPCTRCRGPTLSRPTRKPCLDRDPQSSSDVSTRNSKTFHQLEHHFPWKVLDRTHLRFVSVSGSGSIRLNLTLTLYVHVVCPLQPTSVGKKPVAPKLNHWLKFIGVEIIRLQVRYNKGSSITAGRFQ